MAWIKRRRARRRAVPGATCHPHGGSERHHLDDGRGDHDHRRLHETTDERPGTTLEAEERDDGNGSPAPWLIGSGIAAAAAVAIGGTLLKRRAG